MSKCIRIIPLLSICQPNITYNNIPIVQLETGTPEQPTILQELQQRYSNLQVAGLNLLDSVMDTPLHSILTSGRLDKSSQSCPFSLKTTRSIMTMIDYSNLHHV